MKKTLLATVIFLTSLATTGCLNEYYEKLDELKSRADALQVACDELNANVLSLQGIVRAIESNDLITGMSQITEGGNTVGYKINFAKNPSISIYNGVNGSVPVVGSKKEGDTYYWTVKYGDDPEEFVLDLSGEKVPAVGKVPKFRIVDGIWQMSFDTVDWVEVGKANGDQGDSMFKSIDASGKDYVIITMTDGTVFKIPTYSTYSKAKQDLLTVNSNAAALCNTIDAIEARLVYVTDCSPVIDTATNEASGMYVRLSNGKEFTVRNWVGTNIPFIYAERDSSDRLYYWAVRYGDEDPEWILDAEGAKIPAISEKADAPLVGMEKAEDGNYYWTVTYSSDSTVILGVQEGVHAMDSIRNSIFKSVTDNPDNLVLELLSGAVFKLPKQFSVSLSAADTSHVFSGDTLTMNVLSAGRDTAYVKYQAFGATSVDVSFIAQGGFQAKATGDSIMIAAPARFEDNQGKVVAFFSLDGPGSTRTVVKTIYIKKKEEQE